MTSNVRVAYVVDLTFSRLWLVVAVVCLLANQLLAIEVLLWLLYSFWICLEHFE